MGKKARTCAKVGVLRLLSSRKWHMTLFMLSIFSFYVFVSFYQLAKYFGETLPPVISIFFLSFYRMLVLHGGLATFLFADVADQDGYAQLMLIRSGRKSYIFSRCLYILLVSVLYSLVPLLLSVLFVLPVFSLDNAWGRLLYTLANSLGAVIEQTQVPISFAVSLTVLNVLSPYMALFISFLFLWLSTAFIGFAILFFHIIGSRMSGIVVAGIFAALPMLAMFDGVFTVGQWLSYISPVSWSYIGNLDWYRSGIGPSPEYAGAFLTVGIVLFGIGAVVKFCKGDLKE